VTIGERRRIADHVGPVDEHTGRRHERPGDGGDDAERNDAERE